LKFEEILEKKKSEKFFNGNELVVRGALEVAVYFEFSVNEKVALEVSVTAAVYSSDSI